MICQGNISEELKGLAEAYVRLEARKSFGPLKSPNLKDDEEELTKREQELIQFKTNEVNMKVSKK